MLVNQTFIYKNRSRRYKYLVVNGHGTFFTTEETLAGKKYDEALICQNIDFLTDNIYIKIGSYLCRQCIGILMGASCVPPFVNLFLGIPLMAFDCKNELRTDSIDDNSNGVPELSPVILVKIYLYFAANSF